MLPKLLEVLDFRSTTRPRPLLDAIGNDSSSARRTQQYYKVKVSEIVVEDVIRSKYSSP